MSLATKATILGALASAVAAHGTVKGFSVDGQYHGGFLLEYYYLESQNQAVPETAGWYAENLDNGFIDGTGYTSPDIICHKAGRPATSSVTVPAGAAVDFHWTEWPESHIGPVLTYIARCAGDCADADKTALKWVKIDEGAIDLATQEWVTDAMIANNNTYSITMPTDIEDGNYVLRHEIIALHGAGAQNGAQNYPQCMNIAITGGGSASPEGVLGTALYTPTDPGILMNPYGDLSEYAIPGPALYSGGSSGGNNPAPAPTSAAPAPTSAAATTAAATDSPIQTPPVDDEEDDGEDCEGDDEDDEEVDDGEDCEGDDDDNVETPAPTAAPTTLQTSTRPATPTTPPSSGQAVAIYGQCGGKGYSGSTTCASGSTCKVQNDYYSQCVPGQ